MKTCASALVEDATQHPHRTNDGLHTPGRIACRSSPVPRDTARLCGRAGVRFLLNETSRFEPLNLRESKATTLPKRWNNFSLSPGERAGVRVSVKHTCIPSFHNFEPESSWEGGSLFSPFKSFVWPKGHRVALLGQNPLPFCLPIHHACVMNGVSTIRTA